MRVVYTVLLALVSASQADTVWISPSGSDQSGQGSQSAPWATPQRAIEYVKAVRQQNGGHLTGDITVQVEPGVYAAGAVELDAEGSGDAGTGARVSFVAQQGAVWSAGVPLLGPQPGPNGTLLLRVPDDVPCNGNCRQVFRLQGGLAGRRNMSRLPLMTYKSITSKTIVAQPGALANVSALALQAAEAVYYQSWTSSIARVTSRSGDTLSFAGGIDSKCYGACGNRFFLRNLLDPALIAPGTFAIDDNRTVTYRPLPGEAVQAGDLVVPGATHVLAIGNNGSSAKAANVLFQGITFSHSAAGLSACLASGCRQQSASGGVDAAVRVTNATGIDFVNVTVASTGHYGVWFGQGTSGVSLRHSLLADLGAGGVRVGVPAGGAAADLTLQARDVVVSDCRIRDTGRVVMAGAGVLVQQSNDVVVTHNDIGPTLYTGVSTGWTWDYSPTSVSNISVTFNDIHDVFQGQLSDGGCVYTLGKQPLSVVANNRCWNVHAFGYGGWGTYTDQASSFIVFRDNLIHSTKSAGHHQHFGEDNIITNNIFAYPATWPCDGAGGCDNAALRSSQHPSGLGSHSSFNYSVNIVLLRTNESVPFFTTIPTGLNNDTLDRNVYWSETAGSSMPFGPTQHQESFAAWQASGKDVHSVVADPLFVDPENGDFSLRPDSPALKLGFKPIDFSTNGPRPMDAHSTERCAQ